MTEDRKNRGTADPLDAYLDGILGRDELPDEVRRDEEALAGAMSALDTSRVPVTSVRPDVMRRIDALPRSRWNDFLDWCLRPRTVSVTPAAAGGFALAALAALAFLQGPLGEGERGAQGPMADSGTDPALSPVSAAARPATGSVSDSRILTRFVFVAPDANRVTLTGDWLGWDPDRVELVEHGQSGIWTVEVPVPAGVHEYSFVVDDRDWRPDPLAGSQAEDGFGRTNSILMVSRTEV